MRDHRERILDPRAVLLRVVGDLAAIIFDTGEGVGRAVEINLEQRL